MARVFILGPSKWWGSRRRGNPMDARLMVRDLLRNAGHDAFVMEETGGGGPPLQEKFHHLMTKPRVTHILLYWPRRSDSNTFQQETVILYGHYPDIPVFIFYEKGVLIEEKGVVVVASDEERGRYTNDLLNAGHTIVEWDDGAELRRQAHLFAKSLDEE